jgi:SAM-dependent methyltransferase
MPKEKNLSPEVLIKELGIEGLCRTAEEYYSSMTCTKGVRAKPFAEFEHAPVSLVKLGLLLEGLRLGKSMRVLDFGAGTCWLSRALWQMGVKPIALDPSETALKIGQEQFKGAVCAGGEGYEPEFMVFDGRRIELDDESVDRISCFDSFHHVPNPEEILGEFKRVLTKDGLIGFCEPGPGHHSSHHSQFEMREKRVLEKDVYPDRLFEYARSLGFTGFFAKPYLNVQGEFSFSQYKRLLKYKYFPPLSGIVRLWKFFYPPLAYNPVFFLGKGKPLPDSRSEKGLSFTLDELPARMECKSGLKHEITLKLHNTGSARWLAHNWVDVGVVKLGAHLLDHKGDCLDWDWLRVDLPHDMEPGDAMEMACEMIFTETGDYLLQLDMVSENICWFGDKTGYCPSVRVHVV